MINSYRADQREMDVYMAFPFLGKLQSAQWRRLCETMEFCRRMNYRKIGVTFCEEWQEEAKVLARVLHRYGFHVATAMCRSDGLLQAAILNEQETEFNFALGLCMGVHAPFYQYSKAMVTTITGEK